MVYDIVYLEAGDKFSFGNVRYDVREVWGYGRTMDWIFKYIARRMPKGTTLLAVRRRIKK